MKLGWVNPPTSGYGYGYTPDYYTYGYANMPSPNATYYGGVVGYTSGTVVWTSTWVPVVDSPSPTLSDVGNGKIGIVAFGSPVKYGTLVVSATVDGVPCENSLRIVFAQAYGYYGNAAWDTVVAGPPPEPQPPKPLGWAIPINAASNGALSQHGAGTFAAFYSFDPLHGGVIGYTSGAVVWDVAWTPVVDNGGAPVVFTSTWGVRVEPKFRPDAGTLLLSATVHGVLCSTVLRAVFAPRDGDIYYGSVAWDVLSTAQASEFWTDVINTSEYL